MELDLERFQEVWAKIMAYFEKVFSILFGGFVKDDEETTVADGE